MVGSFEFCLHCVLSTVLVFFSVATTGTISEAFAPGRVFSGPSFKSSSWGRKVSDYQYENADASTTPSRTRSQQRLLLVARRMASRPICAFDSTDFARPTGQWPYTDSDMARVDNSDDSRFYDFPRFVTHIDDRAIESLTNYYREELTALAMRRNSNDGDIDVLDLCSSWVSHLPDDDFIPYGRVAGIGMNKEELAANKQLTEYYVQDLNKNPSLEKFDDESFDVICNVVSVDYLTKPLEIFREMHRILRPGGVALISFSNRCFPTKAISMWLQADDIGRLTIVGSYFHYSAVWDSIEALDIKLPPMEGPKRPSFQEVMANPGSLLAWANTAAAVAKANTGDPMYVVKGVK